MDTLTGGAKDAFRILQPGRTFAFSVMHSDNGINGGWVPDFAVCTGDPPFQTILPQPVQMAVHGKPQWVEPAGIEQELRRQGFVDIEVKTIKQLQHIDDAEHYSLAFAMMTKWIINTYWTPEQKEESEPGFNTRLIEHLKEKHGGKGWDVEWIMILATARVPQ